MHMVASVDAEAKKSSGPGWNSIMQMCSECRVMSAIAAPVSMFQSLTRPSPDPLKKPYFDQIGHAHKLRGSSRS